MCGTGKRKEIEKCSGSPGGFHARQRKSLFARAQQITCHHRRHYHCTPGYRLGIRKLRYRGTLPSPSSCKTTCGLLSDVTSITREGPKLNVLESMSKFPFANLTMLPPQNEY